MRSLAGRSGTGDERSIVKADQFRLARELGFRSRARFNRMSDRVV